CFADDLLIFSRGDVDSAHVIMDSLDEFIRVSGLVPSIHKSTAFFCNVLNHVKLDILNIMSFAKGELSVKYLGVPLISSRLLNRDCKILVEKAKNHIGDWKNKSLSFAGRLQLLADMEANDAWLWPYAWMQKAPILGNILALNLDNNCNDLFQWRDVNGQMKVFSVKNAWEAIRPRGGEIYGDVGGEGFVASIACWRLMSADLIGDEFYLDFELNFVKSRGDLLEDDNENLKRSDGFRSEDVIDIKKNDYHI
nr:reverse transcriptase domain, reverse transcriptase zinc-binding domain protein [Tanacetum cinerariifolium]